MKLLSYEEWIKQNPEAKEECDNCFGTGKTDCPHCNQEMDCEKCDGIGHYGRRLYREQLGKDRNLVQFAQEHGLISI